MFLPHRLVFDLLIVALVIYSPVASFLAYLKRIDGIIKRGRVQETSLRVGRASEVPHLDMAAIEGSSREMEALGFLPAGDYVTFSSERTAARAPSVSAPLASPVEQTAVPPDPMETAGFGRMFLHEEQRCIGKLIFAVVMPKSGAKPTTTVLRVFVSTADAPDGGDIWSYATSDRADRGKTSAIMALWRLPRILSTRLPDAPLPDVLRVHLQRRAQVAQVAGLVWNRATVREALEAETRGNLSRRACFEQLTPLSMAWQLRRYGYEKNKFEWLGELRGQLPSP